MELLVFLQDRHNYIQYEVVNLVLYFILKEMNLLNFFSNFQKILKIFAIFKTILNFIIILKKFNFNVLHVNLKNIWLLTALIYTLFQIISILLIASIILKIKKGCQLIKEKKNKELDVYNKMIIALNDYSNFKKKMNKN